MEDIDMPYLIDVKVAYTVERTVQVWAFDAPEAKRLARDPSNWADAADDQNERMDTVRVLRDQS